MKLNSNKSFIVALFIVLAVVTISGCSGDGAPDVDTTGTPDGGSTDGGTDGGADTTDGGTTDGGTGGETLTGQKTYSGDWSGSIGVSGFEKDFSGTWQFEVNFDEGTVEGWFEGDGSGDITGSVSEGVIEASGEAGFGAVEWSGDFLSGGEDVEGTWEISEEASNYGAGSGTWSGSLGELETSSQGTEDEEKKPPEEDQASGDEPLERYPGAVMLSHSITQTTKGSLIEIEYGTTDSIDEVVDWYEGELDDRAVNKKKEESSGETTLNYLLDKTSTEYAEITISTEDYTIIEVEYTKAS